MSLPQSPYELMVAAREVAKPSTRAKRGPVLSEAQKAARKKADSIAARRAFNVLKDRHREEYNALARAERHALYARIDAAHAAGLEIVLP